MRLCSHNRSNQCAEMYLTISNMRYEQTDRLCRDEWKQGSTPLNSRDWQLTSCKPRLPLCLALQTLGFASNHPASISWNIDRTESGLTAFWTEIHDVNFVSGHVMPDTIIMQCLLSLFLSPIGADLDKTILTNVL